MKYPNIAALVPATEHFDEAGIIGEGGFISTKHLAAIENDLATNAQALDQANTLIENHVATIDGLNSTIATLRATENSVNDNVTTLQQRIAVLEAENKELGGKSSGAGSVITTKQDAPPPAGSESKLPRWDSAEHPANKMADKIIPSKK